MTRKKARLPRTVTATVPGRDGRTVRISGSPGNMTGYTNTGPGNYGRAAANQHLPKGTKVVIPVRTHGSGRDSTCKIKHTSTGPGPKKR